MKCKIIDGTFIDSDGSRKGAGQFIELDEDMAKVHAGRIRPATAEELAEADTAAVAEKAQAPALAATQAVAGDADVDAEHH